MIKKLKKVFINIAARIPKIPKLPKIPRGR